MKRTLQVVMSKRVMKRVILADRTGSQKTPCKLVKNRRKSLVHKELNLPGGSATGRDGLINLCGGSHHAGKSADLGSGMVILLHGGGKADLSCRGGVELVEFRCKLLSCKELGLPMRGEAQWRG